MSFISFMNIQMLFRYIKLQIYASFQSSSTLLKYVYNFYIIKHNGVIVSMLTNQVW